MQLTSPFFMIKLQHAVERRLIPHSYSMATRTFFLVTVSILKMVRLSKSHFINRQNRVYECNGKNKWKGTEK